MAALLCQLWSSRRAPNGDERGDRHEVLTVGHADGLRAPMATNSEAYRCPLSSKLGHVGGP